MNQVLLTANTALFVLALAGCSDHQQREAQRAAEETQERAEEVAQAVATVPENGVEAVVAAQNQAEAVIDHSPLAATDQGENEVDLGITARLRQAVIGEASLSAESKNVVIITRGAIVSLQGPVPSARERDRILVLARAERAATRIDDNMVVANPT